MASPDVSKYVDLSVYDDDPVKILNSILASGRAILPTWKPEAGQIEVVLSEIFANRTSQLAAGINRLPSATTEVLLQLFGLTRSNGTKATATLSITQASTNTLPAGTQFLYSDPVSNKSYIFELDADFASTSGTAAVTAQDVGSNYNISADGKSLSLLAASDQFQTATFSASPTGGAGAESDTEYFDRGTALLASYTTASTTSSQITNYVGSNKTYANRVATYDRRRYRDRDTTASSYGVHDGHVLVAVGGVVSTAASAILEVPVSATNLNDLHTSLAARTPSGLSIDVMSAELAKVHVTASVAIKSGAVFSTVQSAISDAIKNYLDPNAWDLSQQTVRRNEIISLIDGVANVDYVSTLTMDAATVIGSSNVGYYADSGGSKATFTMGVNGAAASQNYAANTASIYYVDSSSATAVPTVYQFTNAEFTTDGSGDAAVTWTAVSNGINFNDANNSGVIPASNTSWNPVAGDWTHDSGNTPGSYDTPSAITGGSNDSSTFNVLNNASPTSNVSTDIYLRNLGTLVTFGTLTITQAS